MYKQFYLVDDEDLVNTINTIHFGRLGLDDKVKSFTNPELALDDLRFREDQTQRTLILLDINMPEMTGFEFLEFMKLENFSRSNEVLLVTSSRDPYDIQMAGEFPEYVKGYINKPLKIQDLEAYLQRASSPARLAV
ncbi:response regulator [Robiginitalea sp. SC105]|uniref:response regulator n=1 Tax=Robiginitalea sp. SC105 TaxID=2762332 RepID=UPI001639E111|nr:response regulator [Robiginitalea sp. SC105]MBC2840255.1 response regulator [Robiginitalea sp. SC105]